MTRAPVLTPEPVLFRYRPTRARPPCTGSRSRTGSTRLSIGCRKLIGADATRAKNSPKKIGRGQCAPGQPARLWAYGWPRLHPFAFAAGPELSTAAFDFSSETSNLALD